MTPSSVRSACIGLVLIALVPAAAMACKYTVRDVGFVDLGTPPYRVYVFVRSDTPDALTQRYRQSSLAALMDSNVELDVVNVDRQPDFAAVKYVKEFAIKRFPSAIMVSPQDRVLIRAVPAAGAATHDVVWTWLEGLVISPARNEILERLVDAYCVVLLIDGQKPSENAQALQVVRGAIKDIAGTMDQMPKPTKDAPALVHVTKERAAREEVLLWSLGLDADDVTGPCAAVIYGRGRWIGPMFKGRAITQLALVDVLSLIGGSCECGLDRRQMLGVMLPMRWDDAALAKSARVLGFDPENPMVKAEISRILSMGPTVARADGLGDGLLGYTEQVVEFSSGSDEGMQPEETTSRDAFVEEEEPPPPSPSTRPSIAQASVVQTPRPPISEMTSVAGPGLGTAWTVVGGMAIVIVVGGVFVILRAQRRAA